MDIISFKEDKLFNDASLNASDVASILHIGRNAVYALAKSGELPSYKLGRKILFSMKDVQAYLESKRMETSPDTSVASNASECITDATSNTSRRVSGATSPSTDGFVIAGQGTATDILVDRLQTLGMPASRKACGSYTGLVDIYNEDVDAALIHLYDQRTNSYNVPYVQRLAPGTPVTVFRLMRRWQGFAVAKGNPKTISSWGALLREGIRLANRHRGCGSRVLLDEKLMAMEAVPWSIAGYDYEYSSALAACDAVATGIADVAVVSEQAASQIDGIDFVKLQHEWLDIVIAKKGRGRELCRTMKSFFADESFKREYGRIIHGEDESLGAIVYEC